MMKLAIMKKSYLLHKNAEFEQEFSEVERPKPKKETKTTLFKLLAMAQEIAQQSENDLMDYQTFCYLVDEYFNLKKQWYLQNSSSFKTVK